MKKVETGSPTRSFEEVAHLVSRKKVGKLFAWGRVLDFWVFDSKRSNL